MIRIRPRVLSHNLLFSFSKLMGLISFKRKGAILTDLGELQGERIAVYFLAYSKYSKTFNLAVYTVERCDFIYMF